jgi:hypothetical protein
MFRSYQPIFKASIIRDMRYSQCISCTMGAILLTRWYIKIPYFPVDNVRVRYLYIKRSKFVKKNEHARYTVEYFPVDNERVMHTKGLNSLNNEHARYGVYVIH